MMTTNREPQVLGSRRGVGWSSSQEKIEPRHHERLAVVYVRQSTAQQVLDHQESTRLQYGLREYAQQLGWSSDRVVVIDDDLGKSGRSAEGRIGFQRLVSEVSLDRVGIVLGIEMSRLARSCKDWHQLLEICARFGTLIADADGVYDPARYNDRLLLGLKGTMSEAELHLLRQRMHQGRISKASRGELSFRLAAGYLRRPSGEVVLDPDEEVQGVVRLIFRKFEELGTLNALLQYLVKHRVRIGGLEHEGDRKGERRWRMPVRATLHSMLTNPIYAGAYAYGRRQADPRSKRAACGHGARVVRPHQEWIALIPGRYPAYITWEQHQWNLRRLRANRSRHEELRAARWGPSLLSGLLVCEQCGRKMSVRYDNKRPRRQHYYLCSNGRAQYGEEACHELAGRCLDEAVTAQVLRVIAPASLELSLAAAEDFEREKEDIRKLWRQRLERAEYESGKAARQYQLVDAENRLVAREVERQWEAKLAEQRKVEEEVSQFERNKPRGLTETERQGIEQLAADIPRLWRSPGTTNAERKEIIRQVIDRIVVGTEGASEKVRLRIEWAGSSVSECRVTRPVRRLEQLSYFEALRDRVRVLAASGSGPQEIAARLNAEGLTPPNPRKVFGRYGIQNLLRRMGYRKRPYRARRRSGLKKNEWTVQDLSTELGMPSSTLHNWIHRGWVEACRHKNGRESYWIAHADEQEVRLLRKRCSMSPVERSRERWTKGMETSGHGKGS